MNNCLLLSDGTVLAMNGGGQCARLTPDIHGSYINGTWTALETMNSSRLFFASDVLTNGYVFVAGGEYGDPNHWDAEIYNLPANTWTVVPGSSMPNFNYSDSPSEMLTNGNLLVSDSQSTCNFYNVSSNAMISGGGCGDMNEVCWVKLGNGAIFGIDDYGANAEHFAPSVNQWVVDATSTPSGARDGDDACYLLPNGQVLHVGSTTNTAFYTPGATQTSVGTLINGTNLPTSGGSQLYAGESPGAMLTTGNILFDLSPNGGGAGGGSPCYFYEYNYISNSFTAVSAPGGGGTYNSSPFVNSMLDLPDGSVLFVGGQNSTSMYVYQPSGTPLAAGQPVISSITHNSDGSYVLTGTGLDGISEGAMLGDDEQMACDYPLVRMTNDASGNVYYARTYNWTPGRVMTGTNVLTADFVLPPNLPAGTFSLVVTAVGNASAPVSFTYSPTTPATPTGLSASAVGTYAYLTWNLSPGATSYNLKRSTVNGGPYTTLATKTAGVVSYTDPTLTNGITYYYVISAANSAGQSANSSQVSATGPIIVTTADQYGSASTYPFTPSWSVVTNGDLILDQTPTTAFGNFTNWPASVDTWNIIELTEGGSLTINSVPGANGGNTTSTNYLTCGNDGSGQTLIYTLSSTIYGSTITNITVYGGWQDNGRDAQNYVVYYSTASNPKNFIPLTSVNYTPSGLPGYTPSATRVTISPTVSGGVLASNVGAVAFIWPANLPSENGDCGYAQISVLGTPPAVALTTTNQYGSANTYPFTPGWTVQTNGDLILHQAPKSASGDFNNWYANVGARNVNFLTGAGSLTINQVAGEGGNTTSTNYVTCGNDGSGATVIYTLSSSAYGCTVTNISVYGGWQDNGRDQQAYTVYYSTPAAPADFLYFATVNYTPSLPGYTPSATRVTIAPTAPGGVLLNSVAAIKFDFTSPPSENGDCGYAQITVAGVQNTPPQLPKIGVPQVSGGNLIITGTGGTPNSDYTWLFTTNLTPPIVWMTNSTGILNSAGALSNSFPINLITSEGFFRLQSP
ncbi:MAG TPA: fibronectin type III domain-containing protein [Verrucomicrobiae bacterium]|nr:fibronectin type III domain-containing protein [Verrucomicrobiae bacterium]